MMQNGQPKKIEPLYEEKLQEMERKYGIIQDRIKSYDSLVSEFSSLRNKILDLQEKLDGHTASFSDLQKNQEKTFWSTEKTLAAHQKKQEELQKTIGEIPAKISNMQDVHANELNKLARTIDSLNIKLNHIGSIIIDKDQMEQIMSQLLQQIEFVAQAKQPIMIEIEKLKLEQYKLTEAFRNMQQMPERFDKTLSALTADLQKTHLEAIRREENISVSVDSSLKIFMKEHEERLEEFKEMIMDTPSSNAKVKAEIEDRLQMATLDGQNAVLKIKNVDQQLKLLERKFESLALKLKQYELSK